MQPNKIVKSLSILLCMLLLTGCWDARSIDRKSYITIIGIDRTEQGMFRVFAQVVIPRKLVGGDQGGGSEEKTFVVLNAEGTTLLEAIRNMETGDSRHLDFGHVRACIFSERAARADLTPLLNFFMSYPQFPINTWMLISTEDMEKLMETQHYSEQMPALFVDIYFANTGQRTSQTIPVQLWEFHRNLTNAGLEPFAPCILLKQESNEAAGGGEKDKGEKAHLQIKGSALFHRGVMTGRLDPRETQYLNWFWNKRSLGTFILEDPHSPSHNLTLTIQKAQVLTNPYYNSQTGQISFLIRLKLIAYVDESLSYSATKQADEMLTVAAKRALELDLQRFITKLQQDYRIDALGLGYKFRRKYPAAWAQLNWYEAWPNTYVKTEVELTFRHRGEIQ